MINLIRLGRLKLDKFFPLWSRKSLFLDFLDQDGKWLLWEIVKMFIISYPSRNWKLINFNNTFLDSSNFLEYLMQILEGWTFFKFCFSQNKSDLRTKITMVNALDFFFSLSFFST